MSFKNNLGKKIAVLGAAGLLSTPSSFAHWQPLVRGEKNVKFNVSVERNESQIVDVNVPGYELSTVVVDGVTYSTIEVPGYPGLFEKGNPDLPRIAANMLVADGQKPMVEIENDEYVDIQLKHPLISSKGHFTRDISPETVAYTFSDVYEKDKFFPSNVQAVVSDPFVIHNVSGVNIHFNLFQYNPVKKVLRVHRSLKVRVNGSLNRQPVSKKIPSFVENLISRSFINYEPMISPLGLHNSEVGRMVIICHDDFVDVTKPYMQWKQKLGIPVKMVKMSEVGKTAEDVKAFIKSEFEAGNLSYVHLVGDVEQIPTLRGTVERAHSDQTYGLLAGDDWYLDIVVSRFCAQTAEKIAYQVAKTIAYEAKPDRGDKADWYKKGVGIASNEGNPKDWAYADKLRDGLLSFTYSQVDQIYDPKADNKKVAAAVNDGRSVINYIGHGSSYSWVSSGFNTNDIAGLTNGNKLPYIWSVACVNGTFAGTKDSFAETWLNAGSIDSMKGAVAIAAASTNMEWVPPLHWQAEVNLVLLPAKNEQTFGGLSLNGMAKLAEVYGPTSKSFKMFVEQTNNFGDGSLKIRYDKPQEIALSSVEFKDSKVSVAVQGGVKDLTVTVYNKNLDILKVAKTDANGKAELDFTGETVKDLAMTISGVNVAPIVDMVVAREAQENFDKLYKK